MKLELGDIKMDSESGIRIEHADSTSRRAVATQLLQPTLPDSIRVWSAAMIAPVVAMAIFGLGALLLVLNGQPVWLVALMLLTLQVPAIAFFLAARSRFLAGQQANTTHESLTKDQQRLLELLAQPQGRQTISQICRRLTLPENRALELVQTLLISQQLEEDVDLESGHFVYCVAEKTHVDSDHKSAAERIAETQNQRKITKELK